MFIRHLSKREKYIFYFASIIILCVCSYIFLLEPLWSYWKELNKTILAKELQVLKNMKILAQKDIINQLYDKYADSIKMKGSVEEETATILKEIENIARSSSTYITDIKPYKVKDMDFYKEYYVELEAEGNIASLTKFIYELQSSNQILKVRRLQLSSKDNASDTLKGYMIVTKILIP